MKYAADFRSAARAALRGKWGMAVIAGLIASLLGAAGASGPEVNLEFGESGAQATLEFAGRTIYSIGGSADSEIAALLMGGAVYIMLAAFVIAAIYVVLGSIIDLGYARFNLTLIDGEEGGIEQLFGYFPYWKSAVCARLLQGVYVFLWSLLLVIPGIVAMYSYAMTEFILAEHPEMSAGEAIAASKELMAGNRARLFCLGLSFIGWSILSSFTFGIGNLWLRPYRKAARAAFYREISGTRQEDWSAA